MPWPGVPFMSGSPFQFQAQAHRDFDDDDEDENEGVAPQVGPRDTKGCPLCRELSNYVYKAIKLPAGETAKDILIRGCKAEKKRILCRDFEASLSSTEGFYCPRFNGCQYAHLKPAENPNQTVRSESFTFTEERIKQLKHRRVAEANHAEMSAFLSAMSSLRPNISVHLEELLNRATDGMHGFEVDLITRELISEFFESYNLHVARLENYAHRHGAMHTFTFYGPGTENAGRSSTWQVTAHKYHHCDIEGNEVEVETVAGDEMNRLPLRRPGVSEWTATLPQLDSGNGVVLHHYLAPSESQFEPPEQYREFVRCVQAQNTIERQRVESGPATDNVPERQMYHLWNSDGDFVHMFDNNDPPVSQTHPSFTNFTASFEQYHAGLGQIVHHFLSPLSSEEAEDIIVSQPDYQALRAAILSQREHIWGQGDSSRFEPFAAMFRTNGFNGEFQMQDLDSMDEMPPGGLPFMLPGLTADEILENIDEYAGDGTDPYEDEYWESDDSESDIGMPALVRITSSDRGSQRNDDNNDSDGNAHLSGHSNDDTDEDMPSLVNADADTDDDMPTPPESGEDSDVMSNWEDDDEDEEAID